MNRWADYLISEVNYDSEHLISIAIRHQDTDKGITIGIPVDRLTISSDIKSGLLYSTIYHGINTWKKGKVIQTFFIDGTPYLRIDGNKVRLDHLGDLPNSSIVIEERPQELESPPKPKVETPSSSKGSLPKGFTAKPTQELESPPKPKVETPSSSKGSLPKGFTAKPTQELESPPKPKVETQENDEVTPEQLSQVNDLEHQIDELENVLFSQLDPTLEVTPEQLSKIKELEKEIEKLETIDLEHEIIQTLQNQNKKLDNIEKKLHSSTAKKSTAKKSTAKKSTAKKSTAKKSTAKKSTAKKSTAKKSTAKKSTAKKSTAKKSTAKKSTAKKSTAKKSTAKKST